MSRSTMGQFSKRDNPIKRYLEFNGTLGTFSYWDGDLQERIVTESIDVVILDIMASITGWSDQFESRIYSNRVRSCVKESFDVKAAKTVLASGKYKDIKQEVAACGGKYTTNVFALTKLDDDDDYVLSCVFFKKSSLQSWTTYVDSQKNFFDIYHQVIHMEKGQQLKKGSIKYYNIDFTPTELSQELNNIAANIDETILQPYLVPMEHENEAEEIDDRMNMVEV